MRDVRVIAACGGLEVRNTRVCAERRLIAVLRTLARRRGVPVHGFATWVCRTMGRVLVSRRRADGSVGCSLPCVECRKALKRARLPWEACPTDNCEDTCRDSDETCPPSRPTTFRVKALGWVRSRS